MKKHLAYFALLLVVLATMTACGAASQKNGSQSNSPAMDTRAPGADSSGMSQEDARAGSSGGESLSLALLNNRKIAQNAQVTLRLADADKAVDRISEAVREADGYVQDMRQEGAQEEGRSFSLSLRVPAEKYGDVVQLIAGLGEVKSRREWSDDITEEYVDVEARIKTKETHLSQLRKLYERSGSIKELMELEQEINRVSAELESLQARMRVLSNQTTYSFIQVDLYEDRAPMSIDPPASVWGEMRLAFTRTWNQMINLTGAAMIALVGFLPVLMYLAVLAGIVFLIVRIVRGKFRRPPAA